MIEIVLCMMALTAGLYFAWACGRGFERKRAEKELERLRWDNAGLRWELQLRTQPIAISTGVGATLQPLGMPGTCMAVILKPPDPDKEAKRIKEELNATDVDDPREDFGITGVIDSGQ